MRLDALEGIVGPEHVVTDPDLRAGYERDWTGLYSADCLAVVRPADTEQVCGVLAWCGEQGVPVVVQGGNTGLVGGGVPGPDGPRPLLLSTRRLLAPPQVDGYSLTVGAGVTLHEVQVAARQAGRLYGVDLAARDSATIGGTVATNAGGIRVCRFGMTRAQVRGVQAVLPDGSVISRLAPLHKDNTGYDLAGLLTGSEGTLAVVTTVRLALHDPLPESVVAVVAVETLAEAVELAHAQGAALQAAEIIDRPGWQAAGGPDPGPGRWIALVEADLDGAEIPERALVAVDAADRGRMWGFREIQSDLADQAGIVEKADLSLPLDRLDEFTDHVLATHRASIFGHVADGSLHVQLFEAGEAEVMEHVLALGGAVSSEHGVGRVKTRQLLEDRGPADVAAMRSIKRAWDPTGLMNPGVLFGQ